MFFLFYLGKPQKSFDDLFGENTKKHALSDDDDSFKMSESSDDDFIPKSGIHFSD
jgi:hypothetical protein